jgi:hypothetical protein
MQAGARKVYAVEASNMAALARRLADGNPQLGRVIDVINSKVEEIPEGRVRDKVSGCVCVHGTGRRANMNGQELLFQVIWPRLKG